MRKVTRIEIAKSIKQKKLFFAEDWGDKIDQFFTYVVTLFPLYIFYSSYTSATPENQSVMHYLLPIPILFIVYAVYRKAVEKKLEEIQTGFEATTIITILSKFAIEKNYEVSHDSKNCIILIKDGYIFSDTISNIFLVSDNKIYFTILKSGQKINPPALFSHLTLKKDLENYVRNFVSE